MGDTKDTTLLLESRPHVGKRSLDRLSRSQQSLSSLITITEEDTSDEDLTDIDERMGAHDLIDSEASVKKPGANFHNPTNTATNASVASTRFDERRRNRFRCANKNVRHGLSSDMFLADRKRLIDFVLAFEPEVHEKTPLRHQVYFNIFKDKLRNIGLILETTELEESQDGKTCFIKVHAPLKTLAIFAEASGLRLPLREGGQHSQSSESPQAKPRVCSLFKELDENCDQRLPMDPTAPFVKSRSVLYKIEDRYTMFSRMQRNLLVGESIEKTLVTAQDIEDIGDTPAFMYPVGLTWLLDSKLLSAAYPLHEGTVTAADMNAPFERYTARQRLRSTWATFKRLRTKQPIDEVRNYFGEKIAFYFCWLEFYTNSLLFPAIFGSIALLIGIIYHFFDVPTAEICDVNSLVSNKSVCPTCSMATCQVATMIDSCADMKIEAIFTNYFSIIFTVFMSVWAALFQEGWKRRQSTMASRWETIYRRPGSEQVRPDYYRSATQERINLVSGKRELYVPDGLVQRNLCRSLIFVTTMIVVVVGAVIGIVVFKLFVEVELTNVRNRNPLTYLMDPSLATTITASVLNFIVILILSKGYEKLAWTLTFYEYPRTMADFERSYVLKMYCFQFVNYYSSMFYIAFVYGNLAASPKNMSTVTGDSKLPGFTSQVTIQLATILIIQQIISNISEVVVPTARIWVKRLKHKATADNPYDQWESDYDLLPSEPLGLAPEYFEMILQYGLITMFVTAFPIAPALALLNNLFEIRVDAMKYIEHKKREVPIKADGIGIFFDLMDFASTVAVVVNGAFIAFSTDFIPRMVFLARHGALENYWNSTMSVHVYNTTNGTIECVYFGMLNPPWSEQPYEPTPFWWEVWLFRIAFMLVYENVVFVIKSLVDKMIPDVPEEVVLKQEREDYLARQALYDTEFGS